MGTADLAKAVSVYSAPVNVFFRISGAVGLKAGLEHLNYHDLWPRGHQPKPT